MLVYETSSTTRINLSELWTADLEVGSLQPGGLLKCRKLPLFFDAELGSKENKWDYKSVPVLLRRAGGCSSCPCLAAANSSPGSRSLLIPRSSLNLSNLPPPLPSTFPDLTPVFFSCFSFFFSPRLRNSNKTQRICVDTRSLRSASRRPWRPRWEPGACIGCKWGIKRVERNMR